MSGATLTRISSAAVVAVLLARLLAAQASDQRPAATPPDPRSAALALVQEGERLQHQGQLRAARRKFIEAEGVITTKQAVGALERVNRQIDEKIGDLLATAAKQYAANGFSDSIALLEQALLLQPNNLQVVDNLALCHYRLGDRQKALSYIDRAPITARPATERAALEQFRSAMLTPEAPVSEDSIRSQVTGVNNTAAGHEVSAGGSETPCAVLEGLRTKLSESPSFVFNLGQCREMDGKLAEARELYERYIALAPDALDAADVQLRLATLEELAHLSPEQTTQVRTGLAAALKLLRDGSFAQATETLERINRDFPGFPPTLWRLAFLEEAAGNVEAARASLQTLAASSAGPAWRAAAADRLESLSSRNHEYSSALSSAADTLATLFERAVVRMEPVSFAFARDQFETAHESLQKAALLRPLTGDVNLLLGALYQHSGNWESARQCFDIAAVHGLRSTFFAFASSPKWKKRVRAVKVEVSGGALTLSQLSWSEKKKGLVEQTLLSEDGRAVGLAFQTAVLQTNSVPSDWNGPVSLPLGPSSLVRVDGNMIRVAGALPVDLWPASLLREVKAGPAARRYLNDYARTIQRFGDVQVKLGKEGLTGGEKLNIGLSLAMAAFSAYNVFAGAGALAAGSQNTYYAISNLNAAIDLIRQSYLSQRQMADASRFKLIPTEPLHLVFRGDAVPAPGQPPRP